MLLLPVSEVCHSRTGSHPLCGASRSQTTGLVIALVFRSQMKYLVERQINLINIEIMLTCKNTWNESGKDWSLKAMTDFGKKPKQESITTHRIDDPRHRKHWRQKATDDIYMTLINHLIIVLHKFQTFIIGKVIKWFLCLTGKTT